MTPLIYALLAAGANVVGALAVTARERRSMRLLDALIAFSAGFMISVALTQLVPQALARGGSETAAVILVGYLIVHLTQHTLTQHFHFGEETHHVTPVISMTALAGLMVHTFIDGVAIASGFAVSEALGQLVFVAIVLHKLPEGLAIASLFLAAGSTRRVAISAAGALGLATLLGVTLTRAVAPLTEYGLALAAGVTLYVAASNLVPEFQAKRGWRLALYFFGGCIVYGLAHLVVH